MSRCTICLELVKKTGNGNYKTRLKCKHIFHKDCLDQWIDSSKQPYYAVYNFMCPNCRQVIETEPEHRFSMFLLTSEGLVNIIFFYCVFLIVWFCFYFGFK